MINLKGKNLCERRKEFNFKVTEAVKSKLNLEDVECAEDSDMDRIFKIELASKYKNVEYLLEELKSSDSLYVTKALKCEWLYSSDYAHLINPEYLHHHIFPSMSFKLKRTTLKTISIYVREETRSQLFYEYCMDTKQRDIALKFLIFTSESFKNEIIKDDSRFYGLNRRSKTDYFRNYIGNSFMLADAYGNRKGSITDLTYLYSLDEEKYLHLFEKHTEIFNSVTVYGVKMSRSILKKHKERILRKPLLYMNVLKRSELLKYSSSEDAKVYAVALLPDYENQFWSQCYFRTHKAILDLIKPPSMFEFIKKIFIEKYKTQEFETTRDFHYRGYYEIMTLEEKQTWALDHLQNQRDVIPEEENYRWYEYIEFAISFKEIKTQMYITTNPDKRSEMLIILLKSAKCQKDLEELFNYYYKRHVNETRDKKTRFIRAVINHHKVLEFNDECWGAFDLILRSLDVYNTLKYTGYDDLFLTTSLVYHIINNKTISEEMQMYLKRGMLCHNLKYFLDQLSDEKKNLVINYIKQCIINILLEYEAREYSDAVRNEVRQYLHRWESLGWLLNVGGLRSYPEIILKYMKLDFNNFQHILGKTTEKQLQSKTQVKITDGYLLRCLKQDASQIVEKLPLIKDRFNEPRKFRINMFLRKIALYFSNDIARQFLEYFTKTLYDLTPEKAVVEHRSIFYIVFVIFQMREQRIKT